MSQTTSQDSHLCSTNLTATATTGTDGASERSSEKSYKIVTQDDFFVGDETAGKIIFAFTQLLYIIYSMYAKPGISSPNHLLILDHRKNEIIEFTFVDLFDNRCCSRKSSKKFQNFYQSNTFLS